MVELRHYISERESDSFDAVNVGGVEQCEGACPLLRHRHSSCLLATSCTASSATPSVAATARSTPWCSSEFSSITPHSLHEYRAASETGTESADNCRCWSLSLTIISGTIVWCSYVGEKGRPTRCHVVCHVVTFDESWWRDCGCSCRRSLFFGENSAKYTIRLTFSAQPTVMWSKQRGGSGTLSIGCVENSWSSQGDVKH